MSTFGSSFKFEFAAEIISGVVPPGPSRLATTTTSLESYQDLSVASNLSFELREGAIPILTFEGDERLRLVAGQWANYRQKLPKRYMSNPDIPLHTIAPNSRSRAAYTPLADQDDSNSQRDDRTPEKANMHTGALRSGAAARATTRGFGSGRSKGKGKQREQYADESDEEATLLGHVERGADGDPDGDDDGDIGGEGQGSTRLRRLEGSQISRVRQFVLWDGHNNRRR